MKVKDLIEQLQKLDPELSVVKQKDDEGNAYHNLHIVADDGYVEKSKKDEYFLDVYTLEDIEEFEDIDDEDRDLSLWEKVVILV